MACLQGQPNREQRIKDALKEHPRIAVDARAEEALSALAQASDSPESSEQD